jgi:hexosaminidase
MKYKRLLTALILATPFFEAYLPAQEAKIAIIPQPNLVKVDRGSFEFKSGMYISGAASIRATSLLKKKLTNAAGITLKNTNKKGNIRLALVDDKKLGTEGYSLVISSSSILIEANTENGLYYGVQSLLQLLPPQIESAIPAKATWSVPCLSITDAPRFPYRGILLDCCRHFATVDEIKKLLDMFAMYKINRFHWHLTEDQAWRIEIKRYPKLTQIGSTRMEDGKPYSGFYTQDQVKEVIRYAAERNIEIIPEIEMPGHALAALSAYPEYSCTGGPFTPRTIWGVEEDVFCAGNQQTYSFLQNILDEVCDLFPSRYIHVGGDECPKSRWKNCPKCQSMMKAQGLNTEMELQAYFTKKIEKYLQTKGKRLFGWDEILEGGIDPSATVMSWRGEKGGIEAANAGHDVVMTPSGYVYLDHYQGDPLCEPVKIGGLSTLQNVYGYDPIPNSIAPEKAHHVLGVQGNLWREYLYDQQQVEYQLFPRVTAIAEIGWTDLKNKNVDNFIQRIDNHQTRWDLLGINYYIPMPEGNTNRIQFAESVNLPFTSNRPAKFVYTLDGTEPTTSSAIYSQPIAINQSSVLKIRTVLPQETLGSIRTITLTKTSPLASISASELQKGLRMKYVPTGNFTTSSQLNSVNDWKDTVVVNVNDFFKLKKKEETGGAAIFEGYIYVEKEGAWVLRCLADQLYLGNSLVIDNQQMKKNAQSDITLPLASGYHPIKVVLLNRAFGGALSQWIDARPMVRPVENSSKDIPTPVYYK